MSERTRQYLTYGVAAASLALTVFFTYLNRNFTSDDALIYYRYVSNVLDGKGLVYNAGERFNGLSSPLYTYISIVAAYCVGNVPVSQTILGGLFLFLSSLTILFFREQDLPFPAVIIAPLFIVTNRYFYATFGLETPLLLFLCVLALVLYQREYSAALAVVAALLLLTRGEGVFLLIVLALAHVLQRRTFPSPWIFVAPVTILLIHYSFNYFYFGAVFPETFMAKVYQGQSNLWESQTWGKHLIFLGVAYQYGVFFNHDPLLLGLPLLLIVIGLTAHRNNHVVRMIAGFLVLYSTFYLWLNIPNYHWYYGVYYLFGTVFAVLGLETLVRETGRVLRGNGRRPGIIAAVLVGLLLIGKQSRFSYTSLSSVGSYLSYREIGVWLKEHTHTDAKIACVEIGHIGWYSQRYVIDILGLVNPYNAKFIGDQKLSEWLHYYHPDYILIHDPIWPHEVSARDLLEKHVFAPVDDFNFPGFKLLKRVET